MTIDHGEAPRARPPARRRSHAALGSRVFAGGLAISGTLGLTDDSEATSKFKVQVVTEDKNVVGTYEVSLGTPLPIDASLAGALRLTIKISQTAGPGCTAARVIDGSKIAFGDVKISK